MKRTQLQRKTPLTSHSTLKRTPMQRKKTPRARAKEFSPKIRAIVMERSSGICELCHNARIAHLHHAVFRSANGTGELSNAIGLCIECHELAHASREIRERCVQLARELASTTYDTSEVTL